MDSGFWMETADSSVTFSAWGQDRVGKSTLLSKLLFISPSVEDGLFGKSFASAALSARWVTMFDFCIHHFVPLWLRCIKKGGSFIAFLSKQICDTVLYSQAVFLFTLRGRESTLSTACVCRNLESNLILYSCLVSKEAHQELNPLNIMLKWPICFVIYVSLRLHMCLWERDVRLHFKRALFTRMQIVLQGRRSYYSAIEAAVWKKETNPNAKHYEEIMHSSHYTSLSKSGTYINHSGASLPMVHSEIWLCYTNSE